MVTISGKALAALSWSQCIDIIWNAAVLSCIVTPVIQITWPCGRVESAGTIDDLGDAWFRARATN